MGSYQITLPATGASSAVAEGKYVRSTRFVSIGAGTSGTVTLPANSSVVLDDFGGTTDAIVAQISGGQPTLLSAKTSSGTIVSTTFDTSGNWVFTGTPSSYPVALVYRVRQQIQDFDSLATDIWGNSNTEADVSDIGLTLSDVANNNASTAAHGFLKKLSNVSTEFMNGVGSWATPNLLKLPESTNSASPNATVPVVALTATDSATNVDIAIIPKGTGSIMCQIPDGGNTNGNKRGTGSVDFQINGRTAANQVTSGNNSFGAGKRNVISGNTSGAIGDSNVSSGLGSMAFGVSNASSSTQSSALGSNNNALAAYTLVTGFQASSFTQIGKRAHSSGAFSVIGDAQAGKSVLRIATVDATATVMSSDANTAASNNQMVLQNNTSHQFRGMISAKQSGSINAAAWEITGLITRGANAAATTLVVSTVTAISNAPAWGTPALAADTTLGALKVTVTGAAATNIRWVANIDTTEVTY